MKKMLNQFPCTFIDVVHTDRLYRDTESRETISEMELYAEFKQMQAESPASYDYDFQAYLNNCLSKNGFLERI